MKSARLGVLLAFVSTVVTAEATPTILIYQSKSALKGKDDLNVDISSFIGKEYDTNGRFLPVVYSPSDPAIKAAMTSGRLKSLPESPRNSEVFAVSRELRVDYLVVVEAIRSGKTVKSKLKLFRGERQIYHDDNDLSVTMKEILDPENTARSIAHTFVLRMDTGPFKEFPDQPKAQNPTLQPGQSPTTASTSIKITPETSDADLRKDIDSLVRANKTAEAIIMLRDAVDASPFDLDRRNGLIDLLQTNHPQAAAQEARRAAILMPDKVELRIQSARAWMKAGETAEAQKDLNEAVARDPNGVATRILLGELSLRQLEPAKAISHLDAAIKQQDSGQARFLRALCRALLGGVDGMQIDLAQSDKFEPNRSANVVSLRYSQATEILDKAFLLDGQTLRSLIPKLIVKPKDQALRDDLEQMLRLVQGRTVFLSSLGIPPGFKLGQDQRLLAHKLLVQTLLDVQSYQSTADEDVLAEARINLGEATKHLQSAQEKPVKN